MEGLAWAGERGVGCCGRVVSCAPVVVAWFAAAEEAAGGRPNIVMVVCVICGFAFAVAVGAERVDVSDARTCPAFPGLLALTWSSMTGDFAFSAVTASSGPSTLETTDDTADSATFCSNAVKGGGSSVLTSKSA